MNIGAAARQAGLPVKTVRYYEEAGLIAPARRASGYRAFSARDLHKLRFVARARALGFTLDECRALLALWEDRGRASADVRAIARDHLSQIDRKLDELREMRDTLADLVARCAGDDRPDCPILNSLADREAPQST